MRPLTQDVKKQLRTGFFFFQTFHSLLLSTQLTTSHGALGAFQ